MTAPETTLSPSAILDRVLGSIAGLASAGVCDVDEIDDTLRDLAREAQPLDALGRETLKAAAIRQLEAWGVKRAGKMVDTAFATGRPTTSTTTQGTAVAFRDPEPWPAPVEGAELLVKLVLTVCRYVALPGSAATAVALWIVFTYVIAAMQVAPILALTSPEKRCGKTTLLTLLRALVPRGLFASNISSASLFRTVEKYTPTLLVDEADTFLKEREELRGILNSGHFRAGATVVRTVGDDHEPRTFSTWCPKAIALIGKLPDTVADRSIVLPLRRRSHDERIERFRLDRLGAELEPLKQQAARWAKDHVDELRDADPGVPGELHDRAADNWRPLLAIADVAGGPWPERARRAAVTLSDDTEAEDAAGVQLLADLRELFDERRTDRLASADIVEALGQREDRPWCEWSKGRPITARQVAKLLRPFGIRPKQYRDGEKTRGYRLEDCEDAFSRYIPPSDPVQPVHPSDDGRNPDSAIRYSDAVVPDGKSRLSPAITGTVPDVPNGKGGTGTKDVPKAVRARVVEYLRGRPDVRDPQLVLDAIPVGERDAAERFLSLLIAKGSPLVAHLRDGHPVGSVPTC